MTEPRPQAPSNSYGEIFRSSSLVGGAAGVSMLLGLARMKFAAVLIGPVGVGLAGTYTAVQTLVGTFAGLGIATSAVRNVATAVANDDQQEIGETVRALRRLVWVTGLLGALAMWLLSDWLSRWTFGNDEHAVEIALLGLVILFGNVQAGQMALIQGMRRIGDLARIQIFTGAVATVFTILCYWLYGLRGIIPALVGSGFLSLCVATLYARRVPVPAVNLSWRRTLELSGGMVRLGFAIMWTSLLAGFVAYMTRALIVNDLGLVEVGLFTAAFTLSGLFVNFVLNAMGADYYPRLTAAVQDPALMRRLVNEQTEIGMLLAVPGLAGILALAPWLILAAYSSEFLPAVELLQWFVLGCIGRVISWPMGFVLLALGRARLFAITETAFNLVHLLALWIALAWIGLEGTALAFFLLYVFYTLAMRVVTNKLIGFQWSGSVLKLALLCLPAPAVIVILARTLDTTPAVLLGTAIATLTALLCMRELLARLGPNHRLSRWVIRVPGSRALFGVQAG